MSMENEILRKSAEWLRSNQQNDGSIKDPVFGYLRNRVAAEASNAFLALGWKENARRALDWLLTTQKQGYWNEVHNDVRESVLETAVVGRGLINGYVHFKDKKYLEAAIKAAQYILDNEMSPGYWKKSKW